MEYLLPQSVVDPEAISNIIDEGFVEGVWEPVEMPELEPVAESVPNIISTLVASDDEEPDAIMANVSS